jgi:hypothetical protein
MTFYLLTDFYFLILDQLPSIFFAEGEEFKSGAAALAIILGAVAFGFALGRYGASPNRDPHKNQIEKLLKEIKDLVIKNSPPPVV